MSATLVATRPATDCWSDAELVRRVVAGKRNEYEVLVRRYLPMVEAFLAGRGLRAADLDEAVQEVMITAYRRLAELRQPERFGLYLLKVAANRRHRPDRRAVSLCQCEEPCSQPRREPDIEPLRAAVARLPRQMQVVLALKFTEELTAEEIALRLNQRVGSVTKTLSRAYRRLRDDPALARWAQRAQNQTENTAT